MPRRKEVRPELSEADVAFVKDLVLDHEARRAPLLEVMHRLQDRCGFLPDPMLREFAYHSRLPLFALQSFVSFYSNFHTTPDRPVEVGVCESLTCHLKGAKALHHLADEVAREFPGKVVVRGYSCLGQCDGAPACILNRAAVLRAPDARVLRGAIDSTIESEPSTIAVSWQDLVAYRRGGGYATLEEVRRRSDPAWVIAKLKESGLRGMGGAGFGAGSKWDFVAKAPGSPKYVVVNADEGEPGTFKDRQVLEQTPHAVLEGVLIACATLGAPDAYVYVRHEYPQAKQVLLAAIEELSVEGILGPSRIHVVTGAGAYICGEETALLESMEGKRGEPRLKPPFPAQSGLWGKPTLINNVETFAYVPQALRGEYGRVRMYSLSGDVERPGVYTLPLKTTARELIETHGGTPASKVKAFFPGGVSATPLPRTLLDVPLDFDSLAQAGSMAGSGAVIVVGSHRCILDVVLNTTAFFAHESCGKCTPCRVGTEKMLQMLERMRRGQGIKSDVDLMNELSATMDQGSICGLGQAAPNPVLAALRTWREEMEAHVSGRCPAGVCR